MKTSWGWVVNLVFGSKFSHPYSDYKLRNVLGVGMSGAKSRGSINWITTEKKEVDYVNNCS
jgi:hypothetical protein